MTKRITDEEFWARAACAALGRSGDAKLAASISDYALKEFRQRFPIEDVFPHVKQR